LGVARETNSLQARIGRHRDAKDCALITKDLTAVYGVRGRKGGWILAWMLCVKVLTYSGSGGVFARN